MTVLLYMIDYIRCGNESGQCIRARDKCDGVAANCLNGWDESETTCSSSYRSHYATDHGTYTPIILRVFNIYDTHN